MTDEIGTVSLPNATWGTYYQAGSGDNNFGNIQEISLRKESFIVPFEATGGGYDSDSTEADDGGGALKTFTLTIEKTSTTSANMKTFIAALDTLINGNQVASQGYPFALEIDMIGSFTVKVFSIDIVALVPSENVMTYTIKLLQASA